MKTKSTLIIAAALMTLAAFITVGNFRGTSRVHAGNQPLPSILMATADYTVLPSNTDDQPGLGDCPEAPAVASGIGCENRWDDDQAINNQHFLYRPASTGQQGKLLLFPCGGNGTAATCKNVFPIAAQQGYHVIGLTYPTGLDKCRGESACFGPLMRENMTGEESSAESHMSEHPQDSILNRLVRVLEWANQVCPGDGWGAYLTSLNGLDRIDWTRVHLAGFSNGSSYASFMGTMPELRSVARVALFAGPNDGKGDSAETWMPMDYIQRIDGITDTHYYGLVHRLNHAEDPLNDLLYKVTRNWETFGMEGPTNPQPFFFDPTPGVTPNFDNAHMLISIDPATQAYEAHLSVVKNIYCIESGQDPDDPCGTYGDELIGYEPAWRCILGTGDASVSAPPMADAGPNQTVECQGTGGARVTLDGSRSTDADCDVLTYTWTGPFGTAKGRNPQVFLPVGTSIVNLIVSDGWSSSALSTTRITVQDTQPPSLQVTLTPALLSPADHKMVRIEAAINASDSCGSAPPTVVLTSITSDQPDNGGGDGDTADDIQDAAFGTLDRSFLLRAERTGINPLGRTYTVTYTAVDASGNRTQRSATVRVPH
jgi:hypothetical protein